MKQNRTLYWSLIGLLLMGTVLLSHSLQADDREHQFETQIRPLLVEHCQACHGPKKQWAELRLDRKEFVLKGGESGPVIIPGNPTDSRLIQVIHYSDEDSQMPPAGKLADEQIALLTRWISDGAYWPEESTPVELDYYQQAKTHWAFQPVTKIDVPQLPAGYRASNPIDHFIAVKLQEKSLVQSPAASAHQQLKRLAYDVTGLPPTYEQMQQFTTETTDDRYREFVDRYLAATDFGVKWARHWLDVARYADTKGYVFTEERRYPFAYTYRDYVIRTFNADLSYQQFIKEQLAADLLPEKRAPESLAALGFLTVGQRFLNRTPDIIDDRIDVTMRGVMGLTLACTRCHDHKFDPLAAADYYALYGVFDSTYEPEELPQIGESPDQQAFAAYQAELQKREQAVSDYEQKVLNKIQNELPAHWEDYLLENLKDLKQLAGQYSPEKKYDLRDRVKTEVLNFLRAVPATDPVFGIWPELIRLPENQVAEKYPVFAQKFCDTQQQKIDKAHSILLARVQALQPNNLYDVVRMYAELLREADEKRQPPTEPPPTEQTPNNKATAVARESVPATAPQDNISEEQRLAWQKLYEGFQAGIMPKPITKENLANYLHRSERDKIRQLNSEIESHKALSPGAPPRAMVLYDKEKPVNPVIFKRGNSSLRGDPVPRRFLTVLEDVRSEPFSQDSSGRLELAEAIVNPNNPLTARVYVNRIWMLLMGQPLVENTDDFGLRTAQPIHQQLLDYLAYEFMQRDWSTKWLIREIVTSQTYRQTCLSNSDGATVDLENQLYWRMNRKRLPFESLRDGMLLAAGQLNRELFGQPESLDGPSPTTRRTIFAYVDRNNVSQLLRTFDVAGPNTSVTRRPRTTVPQQALFVMNSPFVMDLADKIVSNQKLNEMEPTAAVILLYRQVLQRNPQETELSHCLAFVSDHVESDKHWSLLAQTLLLTNEFQYID